MKIMTITKFIAICLSLSPLTSFSLNYNAGDITFFYAGGTCGNSDNLCSNDTIVSPGRFQTVLDTSIILPSRTQIEPFTGVASTNQRTYRLKGNAGVIMYINSPGYGLKSYPGNWSQFSSAQGTYNPGAPFFFSIGYMGPLSSNDAGPFSVTLAKITYNGYSEDITLNGNIIVPSCSVDSNTSVPLGDVTTTEISNRTTPVISFTVNAQCPSGRSATMMLTTNFSSRDLILPDSSNSLGTGVELKYNSSIAKLNTTTPITGGTGYIQIPFTGQLVPSGGDIKMGDFNAVVNIDIFYQ